MSKADRGAAPHSLRAREEFVTIRRLNLGEEYQIVLNFYEPKALADRLAGLGWQFEVEETEHYFVYGSGEVNRQH